jgi:hypothetical protein
MSQSDQFAQDNVVVPDASETTLLVEQNVMDMSSLENLVPKNISSNKRAVIERLVSLYQLNATRG